MRELIPLVRTFRRLLQSFPVSFGRNWHLRHALELLRRVICLLTCEGEVLSAEIIVPQTRTLLRYPDPMARKTVIANLGVETFVPVGRALGSEGNTIFAEIGTPILIGDRLRMDGFFYTVTYPGGVDSFGNVTVTPDPDEYYNTVPSGDLDFQQGIASQLINGKSIERAIAPGAATILENNRIVAVIQPGESRELLLSGRFLIEAKCDTGAALLSVATHRRCPCGDAYVPPYGQAAEPIGGDLI